jgi:NAD(P)-dependent dehydrogenase (short-subunit alcohol dehydrogenase family)
VTAVGQLTTNTATQMSDWHTNCLGLLCDVRDRSSVGEVFTKAIAHFGRIDVIAK